MDAGFTEKDAGRPSNYASTSRQVPFDPYRESSFYGQAGLSEFPFREGLDCLEIDESLMSSGASDFDPPQFFPAAEFSELQPLEEFFQPEQTQRSLSSSSMRSLSVGSPEYSIHFPTAIGDAAIARAMIAVMSSTSSSSPRPSAMKQAWQSYGRVREEGAFKPYSPTIREATKISPGQDMMKRTFSLLRQMGTTAGGEVRWQEGRPTANQLHHMISERRRREKLNENFSALRALLPPGTKKDKASVLTGTIERVNSLRTQITELEDKNRAMEMVVLPPEEDGEDDNGRDGEKERIRMSAVAEPSSGKQMIQLRVTVPADCDMIDLVLHVLGCLRERPELQLLSLDSGVYTKQKSAVRLNLLTIRLKGGQDLDEGPFKEALTRAIEKALA